MPTPRRVVSLSPNVSLMLFALGADEVVVGRTRDCLPAIQQYLQVWRIPEATVAHRLRHWQAFPVVGVWPLADRAAVKALRPEVVLTSGSGPFGLHEARTFGVEPEALHHFDTRTFGDLNQHLQQLGNLLGSPAAAAHVMARLARKRQKVRARRQTPAVPPTVLFEYCVCGQYDPDPDRRIAEPARTVLVGGHLAPELILWSGGRPVCVQPGDTARWVAFDDIRTARPEVILQYDCHGCPTARRHPIPTRPGWDALPAVSRGAIYSLRENISDPNLCFPAALEELVGIFSQQA